MRHLYEFLTILTAGSERSQLPRFVWPVRDMGLRLNYLQRGLKAGAKGGGAGEMLRLPDDDDELFPASPSRPHPSGPPEHGGGLWSMLRGHAYRTGAPGSLVKRAPPPLLVGPGSVILNSLQRRF